MCKEIIMPGGYENRIVGITPHSKAIKTGDAPAGDTGICLCNLRFVDLLHLIADNLEIPTVSKVEKVVDALIITREQAFGEYNVRIVFADDD